MSYQKYQQLKLICIGAEHVIIQGSPHHQQELVKRHQKEVTVTLPKRRGMHLSDKTINNKHKCL